MDFDSLGALAAHVALLAGRMAVVEHHGLDHAAHLVEETAKAEIGSYQQAWGPFVAWAPLAQSTEDAKAAKGYPAGAPLLASGDMRNSIGREVHELEAIIGSTDPKMVYHEFGTSKMPPRPVLGPALYRNKDAILAIIGKATFEGIVAGKILAKGGHFDLE